ncbi:hypothetical protein AC578_4478 [Pseudocercospora eumusae]|uniref:Uncharacterized protein n=1 Tax=Pseudocercospora eumusae TaxID=321146 RepID=A0A139HBS3_9PEZI|nr:hypothetical protein AC578_4478 [Pseudocercospora eumusae]
MRFTWILAALFAALVVGQNTTQQDELARALELLQTMPECARTCLFSAVAEAGISASNLDLSASCRNTTATAGIEACAAASCTIREQLTAKNVTETLCQRPVREASTISISSIIGCAFGSVAYIMRMVSKIKFPCDRGARVDTDFWWDDLTITIAWLLIIPITVLSNLLNKHGMGRDVWTIPFDNITLALKIYYFDELLYVVALPTIKIAILCTYLRVFQTSNFRKLIFVVIGLNVAYAVAFFIVTVFQCSPISLAWTHWDNSHPGTCDNINALSWASAALNIILDVLVVGLPMPMLWNMNLNRRKKILVMLMFGVGSFVTVVSILRLHLLVYFGDSKNLTYDYKQVGDWTVIEVNTALCCACMPGIRNLIRRAFPRLMGTSVGNSRRTPTPLHSALSGPTAVGSGLGKSGTEVYVRPRHSDDDYFMPLQDISTHNLSTHESAEKSVAERHVRNFSRPGSLTLAPWRSVSPV